MTKRSCARSVFVLLAIIAARGIGAAENALANVPKASSAVVDYARPLSFEPNRGQTDKQVDFLAHGTGYNLFLTRGEAVMVFKDGAPVRMSPVGAKVSSAPEPLDEQPGKSNYFIGNRPEKWHTNVANYAKVRYHEVYPGIDLIYYGNQRQLEYDFVVAPGANPAAILLDFEGAAKPALDHSGELVMHTAAGELRWHKPVAYQEVNGARQLVACGYVRENGRLGFRVAGYDGTKPLVIDPVLVYSTYLGGNDVDDGLAIAVDSSGKAYITGSTLSGDFPAKNAYQSSGPGGGFTPNAFVSKFDGIGKLVYSTYLGGSGNANQTAGDSGDGIAVDAAGNAYIVGSTSSPNFPTKDAFQPTLNNVGPDAFVTKLNTTGNALMYSTYLGGSAVDGGSAIAVDKSGSAYVTGTTSSSDFPVENAFQPTQKTGVPETAFVTKFEASGKALVYSTYLGGSGGEIGSGIAVDTNGNAYIAGATASSDFPLKNPFQEKNRAFANSETNAFVTKFDTAGTGLVYSTYLGGSGVHGTPGLADEASGIAVDLDGNAYVTGKTISTDFPTKNPLQKKLKSSSGNAFVAKFASLGTLDYSTFLGGSGGDFGKGIAVDRYGQAYVAGFTFSVDFPTKNAFQPVYGGNGDAFITKIDAADCALVYSSYLGGSGQDLGYGVAVDKNYYAYVTGQTLSTNFPIQNAFQPKLASEYLSDAFVTKISAK